MFFFLLSLVCLVWMLVVIRRLTKKEAPDMARRLETEALGTPSEA
jgi:uncharacterized protein YpmS